MNGVELAFKAIDGEREYQAFRWGKDNPHDVAAFVVFMREYHNKVVRRASTEKGWDGALEEMRKVAALAVACLEQNGMDGVFEADYKPAPRSAVYEAISKEIKKTCLPIKSQNGLSVAEDIVIVGYAISKMEDSIASDIGIVGLTREWVLACAAACVRCMANHGVWSRSDSWKASDTSPTK